MQDFNFEIIDDLFCCDNLAVFMKAYFDESGKHEQAEAISIFGLLMSSDTCEELRKRWLREAARPPRIPLPFHMSDCVAGSKAFEYLKHDEGGRLEMQARMINTLRGLDTQAYGIAIIRKEHALVVEEITHSSEYQNPWFLAFEGAISEIMLGSAEHGKKHTVSLVFDRQDEFRDRAFELYKDVLSNPVSYRDRLGGLGFESKERIVALQAADIVVYEATRYLVDCKLNGGSERWQSRRLREMIDVSGKLLDKSGLNILKGAIAEATRKKAEPIAS